ncbi:MAG: hypothetical protein ACPG4T_22640, partial [Nannocystaceae bacterium]
MLVVKKNFCLNATNTREKVPRSQTDNDDGEFEVRADFILDNNLQQWNVDSPFFENIHKALTGRGAKLLVGPRGCGKTHQMRLAHQSCSSKANKPLS